MILKNLSVGCCWAEISFERFKFSNSRCCIEPFIQLILAQGGFYFNYSIKRFGRNEGTFRRILYRCGG